MEKERDILIEELYNKYSRGNPQYVKFKLKFRYLTKNWAWKIVVGTTYFLKRFLDILASSILLILLSPVFLILAIWIKLDSPGEVFFHQTRVGKWGKNFSMHKFRSMCLDAERIKETLAKQNETGGVIFKMKDDPRVTKIGKFIRKFSLDELPQLWNVLVGEMSLVGPRPPVPKEVKEYTSADRRRLEVTPGITCIWQVSGRSNINFEGQVRLDIEYIYSQSFFNDIKLLLKTIPAVLFGNGAY